ncbi:cytochrome c oxidase assembly factor 7 homolog [Anabrus simplex]|uniref:cytochrome c oxidase assembly factor 7 homolog n=1 Tax=Anabrus simplex TaxID=316456 RepID=UPI0035A2FA45
MAYDLKDESEVKEYIENLGIEYRFGCYQEKKPDVCHLLGDYLEGIKKDFEKACKVYKANCDYNNFSKSCYKFANYSVLGKGLNKSDTEEAFKYYEKACSLGDPDACLNGGLISINSGPHCRKVKDYTAGMAMLDKCCEKNKAYCCFYLSGMYISGVEQVQIKQDMEKAYQYALKGCELGDMHACANVSQMYRKGEGVAKNEELAEKYKKKAHEIQENHRLKAQLQFQQGVNPV